MRKLYILFILAGIALLAYPSLHEMYSNRQQEKLLAAAERRLAPVQPDRTETERLLSGLDRVSQLFIEEAAEEQQGEDRSAPALPEPAIHEPEPSSAVIEIAKIGLKLPVLEGATQANMKHAAAHMSETTPIGQVGNAAIAAHRARAKGRLFNRLDELDIGDQIKVQTGEGSYLYTVYQVSVVEPTDVSVLNRNDSDRILTLITCDPIVEATHRLIVHAKIEPGDATK